MIRNKGSYRRKSLDNLLEENKDYYKGVVLDIGGRDRGRFQKPKQQVEKWIFADIVTEHNPDIVLDVANMEVIETETIDVVNAIELFEHVEQIKHGIKECYRVLKQGGVMILSAPFMYPIHADPYDFQRWTEHKWKKELEKSGFTIEKFQITGFYFTVLADSLRIFKFFKLFYFFLNFLVLLDKTKWVLNNPKLNKFHNGYFMIFRKVL